MAGRLRQRLRGCAMTVIRAQERESFVRCRRAWDLGARARQNYAPVEQPFDLQRAIRDALAVYYFPGMWDWDRATVLPLVLAGFERSMRRQREGRRLTDAENDDWHGRVRLGEGMLRHYFAWAVTVDRFSPVRVDTDFDVNLSDPADPEWDMRGPDGEPIRYRGRLALLAVDTHDLYWLVEHRVCDEWAELDDLRLDERGLFACWAWPRFYLGMRIAGTVYTELRTEVPERIEAPPAPRRPVAVAQWHRRMYAGGTEEPEGVLQEGNDWFRRTRIPRTEEELARAGRRLSVEALAMTDPAAAVYPSPEPSRCAVCAYRPPCLAINAGQDPAAALAAGYRVRGEEAVEEGRLGGVTWGMGRGAMPPRFPTRGGA
ncbi:hypothetical protein BH23ACT8_BH23ACT8_23270 [soil metagenome]